MKDKKHPKEWLTIPILPCVSIEETLAFWESLGYKITYKQIRPYPYGVVERGSYELHFGRIKGMEASGNAYTGCLVMVSDAAKVYREFVRKLKEKLGRVPHSGIPRISRMKPETTRFTLTDVSGNAVIFISYGEQDQENWEKAEANNLSPLQKAMARAVRFRDYKNDEKAAAATLDVALRKAAVYESKTDRAEALLIRTDLAIFMKESAKAEECRKQLRSLGLTEEEITPLKQKHDIKF